MHKEAACASLPTDIRLVCNAEICKWLLKWTGGSPVDDPLRVLEEERRKGVHVCATSIRTGGCVCTFMPPCAKVCTHMLLVHDVCTACMHFYDLACTCMQKTLVCVCVRERECVCTKQKIFSVLSLLAAAARQGAESHYRTSQLPPYKEWCSAFIITHMPIGMCVCVCVCVRTRERERAIEREKGCNACVVHMN